MVGLDFETQDTQLSATRSVIVPWLNERQKADCVAEEQGGVVFLLPPRRRRRTPKLTPNGRRPLTAPALAEGGFRLFEVGRKQAVRPPRAHQCCRDPPVLTSDPKNRAPDFGAFETRFASSDDKTAGPTVQR